MSSRTETGASGGYRTPVVKYHVDRTKADSINSFSRIRHRQNNLAVANSFSEIYRIAVPA